MGTKYPRETPWGSVQHADKLADGIYSLSTASHGGIYLAPYRQLQIGKKSIWLDSAAFWEEDCDANEPIVFFADELAKAGTVEQKWIEYAKEYVSNALYFKRIKEEKAA